MNTNGLAKLYDVLTPRERIPLIWAAVERGDDAEVDRLLRSAPRVGCTLPDHHGLGDGLILLSLFHMIGQLHMTALYLRAEGLLGQWEPLARGKKDREQSERGWASVRVAAQRLTAEADAWTLVCGELKLDPDGLLRDLPGYDLVRRAEQDARVVACTPEEAAAFLSRVGGEDVAVWTVERAAQGMREFLDRRIAWWA